MAGCCNVTTNDYKMGLRCHPHRWRSRVYIYFYVNWWFCAHNTNNRNNENRHVRISILIGIILNVSAFITYTCVMCSLYNIYIYMRRDVCVFGGCWSRTRLLVWTLARSRKTKAQLQIDVYRHRKKKSLKIRTTIGRRIYFIWRRRRWVENWKK